MYIDYNRELADFFGETKEEISKFRQTKNFDREWKEAREKGYFKTDEDVNRFYADNKGLVVHQSRERKTRNIMYRRILASIFEGATGSKEFRHKMWIPNTKHKVLDYGCGIGDIGVMLLSVGFIVDFLEVGDSLFEKYINWRVEKRYLQGNSKFIPYGKDLGENVYDIICCIDVVEHHVNPRQAMIDIHRALKPGGFLFFEHGWFERKEYKELSDQNGYNLFIKPFIDENFTSKDTSDFWLIKK